eukprot:GHVR01167931.1.p1 GENE.GHVR01167931.1~~GHVR01167931.1.p1  ORF type:complete len:141 (+),score=26.40 GHVR01167931.1:130-552(+)
MKYCRIPVTEDEQTSKTCRCSISTMPSVDGSLKCFEEVLLEVVITSNDTIDNIMSQISTLDIPALPNGINTLTTMTTILSGGIKFEIYGPLEVNIKIIKESLLYDDYCSNGKIINRSIQIPFTCLQLMVRHSSFFSMCYS